MASAEVVHAVLQIAHVAEEIFAHLGSGTYGSRRGKRRASADGGGVERGWSCWGVAYKEGGYHDKEKYDCYWKNSDKIRIEADKGVNGKERKCMAGGPPGKQAQHTVLEDEDHTDPSTAMSIPVATRGHLCHTWR